MNIRHIIKVARPTHWIKNIFVFLPVFFGGALLNTTEVVAAALTFMSFSLAASAIYCLNDIIDVDADRAHPVKCKRPIASGAITIPQAYGMMTVSLLISIVLMFLLPEGHAKSILVIIAYFVINVAYCLRLKEYAIIDVCIIASGFVLRILAGGYATGVHLSKWIVLMTFLLTLFLAFAKRKDDYRIYEQTGTMPRKSIAGYNSQFIDLSVTIVGTITMVCYIIYTMSDSVVSHFGSSYVYLTNVWVLAGLLRYLQNMLVYQRSGSPTKVLVKDHFIQTCIVGWVLSFFSIIYL